MLLRSSWQQDPNFAVTPGAWPTLTEGMADRYHYTKAIPGDMHSYYSLVFFMKGLQKCFSILKHWELKMSGNILNLIHLSFLALISLHYVFLCVHISIDMAYKMKFSVYFSTVLYGVTFYNPTAWTSWFLCVYSLWCKYQYAVAVKMPFLSCLNIINTKKNERKEEIIFSPAQNIIIFVQRNNSDHVILISGWHVEQNFNQPYLFRASMFYLFQNTHVSINKGK